MASPVTRDSIDMVVIDADPSVANALSIGVLLRWPESQVFTSPEGKPGVEMVRARRPQLVVTEIDLPDSDGFEVIRRIRTFSDVPIIVLATRPDEMITVRALELGADDYVLKPLRSMNFLARARAILRRYSAYPSAYRELRPYVSGSLMIDFGKQQVFIDGEFVHVTPLEYRILCQLVRNEGRVVAVEALRRPGGDGNAEISPLTLRKSVCRLRQKLFEDLPHYRIHNERGLGYRFTGSPSAVPPVENSPVIE